MDAVETWKAWYSTFEQCALDDRWERLEPLLHDDAQYRVSGVPFACVLRGRDAILSGFRKSFAHFDRRFDRRTHIVAGSRLHEPNHLEAHIWGIYEKKGVPTLAFPATGHWHFDNGRVDLMVDIYDPALRESQAAFEWLAVHAGALKGLDPSYV